MVLGHGRVVERGTHACLLAAGGYYARMWAAAQAAGGWPPGEPAVAWEPAGAAARTAERTQL